MACEERRRSNAELAELAEKTRPTRKTEKDLSDRPAGLPTGTRRENSGENTNDGCDWFAFSPPF
jgi:hypothetical protein